MELIYWTAQKSGPGFSTDSINYIAASRSLLAGAGLLSFTGQPLTVFPPALPVLLAILSGAGLDILTASAVVNATALVGLGVIVAIWVLRDTGSKPLAIIAAAAIYIAPPLFSMSLYVLTDVLSAFEIIGAGYLFRVYYDERKPSYLLAAGLVFGFLGLTRYADMFFILGFFSAAFICVPQQLYAHRYHVMASAALAIGPIALWIVHNLLTDGTATGHRRASTAGLFESFLQLMQTIETWFLPYRFASDHVLMIGFVGGVGLTISIFAAARAMRKSPQRWLANGSEIFFLVPIFVYAALLCASATRASVDPLDDRLCAPLFPFIIIALSVLAQRVFDRQVVSTVALALLCLPLSAIRMPDLITEVTERRGAKLVSTAWYNDPSFASNLSNPNRPLISNDPALAYWVTGHHFAYSPAVDDERGGALVREAGNAWLVWFTAERRSYLLPLDQVAERFRLKEHATVLDVRLYEMNLAR